MKFEKPLSTSSPVQIVLPVELEKTLPIYTRRPSVGGKCPISGLNLSSMDKLIRPQECNDYKPPVKSKRLFVKGASRPTILIDVQSLLGYLATLPEAEAKDLPPSHHPEEEHQTENLQAEGCSK